MGELQFFRCYGLPNDPETTGEAPCKTRDFEGARKDEENEVGDIFG